MLHSICMWELACLIWYKYLKRAMLQSQLLQPCTIGMMCCVYKLLDQPLFKMVHKSNSL